MKFKPLVNNRAETLRNNQTQMVNVNRCSPNHERSRFSKGKLSITSNSRYSHNCRGIVLIYFLNLHMRTEVMIFAKRR